MPILLGLQNIDCELVKDIVKEMVKKEQSEIADTSLSANSTSVIAKPIAVTYPFEMNYESIPGECHLLKSLSGLKNL